MFKPSWVIEPARSNRSKCKLCRQTIDSGDIRIGRHVKNQKKVFSTTSWFHVRCCPGDFFTSKLGTVDGIQKCERQVLASLRRRVSITRHCLTNIVTGPLDISGFSKVLRGRYSKFRSFRFGLGEDEKYSKNWKWRCFIATMVVCNTREVDMLKAVNELFVKYSDAAKMSKCESQGTDIRRILDAHSIRHSRRKAQHIVAVSKYMVEHTEGEVPNTRAQLQKLKGVGRHVASVTLAWVHQKGEFGVDVHVRRIMERLGLVKAEDSDREIEEKVSRSIPSEEVGHFSRTFVDHGQNVCGYSPECHRCMLKHACPTNNRLLDW